MVYPLLSFSLECSLVCIKVLKHRPGKANSASANINGNVKLDGEKSVLWMAIPGVGTKTNLGLQHTPKIHTHAHKS